MAHHGSEDCASVLEQFIQDVANLPAEMNHLMEEIQAKDKTVQECRTAITSRDNSLQKFVKMHGSLAPNAKEEQYSRIILESMDTCRGLQDEKIRLSEKACILLDRQIKKLDVRIRDLQNDGVFPKDAPIPSLFNTKDQYRDRPKASTMIAAATARNDSSPLNPTSANAANANAVTNNNNDDNNNNIVSQRLNQARSSSNPTVPVAAADQNGISRSSAPATPASAAAHLHQRQRESSAGAVDSKRRRLNPAGSVPITSSNLRQVSASVSTGTGAASGPGTATTTATATITPRAGTPASSRAGSAGPRASAPPKKAQTKKVAPHHQVKKIKSHGRPPKRSSSAASNRGVKVVVKKSPSAATTTAAGEDFEDDESQLSSAGLSESEEADISKHVHEEEEEENEEEDGGNEDTKVYCTCRTVSHGDMVACDNDDCPYEWFHWKCVGLTREPVGTWYCEECRKTLGLDK